MTKTLLKSIVRLIRETKGRFLSLCAIVCLGVAFFVGVSASSPIMGKSVDAYDDAMNLKDITVYSNYGFDEEDVERISEVEGVSKAEGAYFQDTIAVTGTETYVTRVHSYSKDKTINSFVLKEGRMPENEHEALAEAGTELNPGFAVGETVAFTYPEGTENEALAVDEVTVVGTIDTPLYLNQVKENSTLGNQYIHTYLYVLEDAFVQDFYLEVDVLMEDGKSYYTFSEDYEDYNAEVKQNITDACETLASYRYDAIVEEAMDAYNDGLAQYEEGLNEYNEKIAEAEQQLADGQSEIDENEAKLNAAMQELLAAESKLNTEEANARAELSSAAQQIADGRAALESQTAEYADTLEEMRSRKAAIDMALSVLNGIKTDLTNNESTEIEDLSAYEALDAKLALFDRNTTIETLRAQQAQAEEAANTIRNLFPSLSDTQNEDLQSALESMRSQAEERRQNYEALKEQLAAQDPVFSSLNDLSREWKEKIQSALGINEEQLNQDHALLDLINGSTVQNALAELQSAPSGVDRLEQEIESLGYSDTMTFGEIRDDIARRKEEAAAKQQEIENNRASILSPLAELGLSSDLLDSFISVLQSASDQIGDGLSEAEEQIASAQVQLDAAEAQMKAGEEELDIRVTQGRNQISAGYEEIASGRSQLEEAKQALLDGAAELEEQKTLGLEELEEAKAKLDEAKAEIDALESPEWTVLSRKQHYATVTFADTVKQMKAIADIFPLFFIAVAALVCLTTMTRMVDEERNEIGTLRALGYSQMACASKFLLYALAAAVIGSVIGVIAGMLTFPAIIYNTWRMMYILPDMKLSVPWGLTALTVGAFLVVMELATWIACMKDMKEVPSQLMRPKTPRLGKNIFLEKIGFIWNRLSFTWKVTIRNIFRYRERFLMTVLGVAGCTALLVTGFGVKDSITVIVDKQFYDIYQYDGMAFLKSSVSEEEESQFIRQLKNESDVVSVYAGNMYSGKAVKDETEATVNVSVFGSDLDLKKVYNVRDRKSQEDIMLDDSGVIISEKLSMNLDLSVGDSLTVESKNGKKRDVKIAGICEMYIQHYMFMSEAFYESVFGEPCLASMVYISVEDADNSTELQRSLAEDPLVDSITFYDVTLSNFRTMVKGLDIITWTLIVSSLALSFVVLGNLINVNLSERVREIATLKVLGFRRKEVESYIYKENNVLTLIGAFLGLPLGSLLHKAIMVTVEMDYVMFGRNVRPISNVLSIVLTLLFSLIVDRAMAKKLHGVKMVESLKSVE